MFRLWHVKIVCISSLYVLIPTISLFIEEFINLMQFYKMQTHFGSRTILSEQILQNFVPGHCGKRGVLQLACFASRCGKHSNLMRIVTS